ncbi:MAG: hypothetical protein PWR13_1082 [Archaeoglobi archaeon]|nr:hypothetical protein [Archaeoglobi archaeon]
MKVVESFTLNERTVKLIELISATEKLPQSVIIRELIEARVRELGISEGG